MDKAIAQLREFELKGISQQVWVRSLCDDSDGLLSGHTKIGHPTDNLDKLAPTLGFERVYPSCGWVFM